MGRSPVLVTSTVTVFSPRLASSAGASGAGMISPGIMVKSSNLQAPTSREAPIGKGSWQSFLRFGGWRLELPDSTNRIVHGDQLRAVGERGLDLHLVDHLGNAFHDVGPLEDGGAM